jgi:hypothetical protein
VNGELLIGKGNRPAIFNTTGNTPDKQAITASDRKS